MAATRKHRTPRERAEEELGIRQRALAKLTDRAKQLRAELKALDPQIADAKRRAEYAAADPALPQQTDIGGDTEPAAEAPDAASTSTEAPVG